jgi:hypothetical protein
VRKFIAEPMEGPLAPAMACDPFSNAGMAANQACVCSSSGWSLLGAWLSFGLTGYYCAYWYATN